MTQTLTREPEVGRIPATVEPGAPIVWGLSARQIHDAYWSGRGVQCVRRGQPERVQRAAELYLLIDPDQLVLFDLAAVAERLAWRNAVVTRMRITDEHGDAYGEHVVLDDDGLVVRIERRYRARTRRSVGVMLTSRRRIALAWMRARSRREGWERIRRGIVWSRIDHWRCTGSSFSAEDARDQRRMLTAIVDRWTHPEQAIDGIEAFDDRVWMLTGERPEPEALLVGPLWIGAGCNPDDGECLIGPAWVSDREPVPSGRFVAATVRPIAHIEPAPPDGVRQMRKRRGWANSSTKRVVDFVVSALALTLALPLFPIVALLIVIDDGRPVFFGHLRQTRGGKTFRCWKFRTMLRNAEELTKELAKRNRCDGPQFYIPDDPRVTRVGRLLRRWHLDELPQIVNVLVGQMSLVGPRPSPDSENQFCPAWRDLRLSVRPGITGLWQLMRTREPGTDFQEWIRYDIEYVRHATFWMDLRICVRTIVAMTSGRSSDAAE